MERNIRRAALLVAGTLLSAHVFAQTNGGKITGIVLDTDGVTPLSGAAIRINGTNQVTMTDVDGKFSITAPQGKAASLTVRYIGYEPKTLTLKDGDNVSVTMAESGNKLNEAVVTALGIKRADKALGYSITKVDGYDTRSNLSSNWLNALDGKVAGLTLQTAGAGPGGSLRVTLRGDQSLNYGSNEALFVVDGVPISSGTTQTKAVSNYAQSDAPVDFGNGASDINPDDIESVSVLKGPAATALYGSRAANGAILITTKKGRAQKGIGVTVNSSVVFERASYFPDFQTEYGSGGDLGLNPFCFWTLDGSMTPDGKSTSRNISRYAFGEKFDATKLRYQYASKNWETGTFTPLPWVYQDDWYTGIFQTGVTFDNNVTIDGNNGKGTTSRLSLTDRRNDWILPNTGYNQQSVSFSLNSDLNKAITLHVMANYYKKQSDNLPVSGYSSSSIMYQLAWGYNNNSMQQWKDEYFKGRYTRANWENVDGTGGNSLVYPGSGTWNPYRTLYEALNGMDKNRFFGNAGFTARIVKGLTLDAKIGIDFSDEFRTQRRPKYSEWPDGFYREQSLRNYESNADFLLRYTNNEWADGRLGFSAAFGGNAMYSKYYNNRITLEKLDLENVYNLTNVPAGNVPEIYTYRSKKAVNSFYGLASLSWDDTYFVDITGRNDWSSTLARGNWSYFYPSVSGSVLLSNIIPFKKFAPWVDYLKYRLSWANVGNDTSPYALDNYYGAVTDYPGGLTLPGTVNDPMIKPENVESWETGLEFSLFKRRLSFDVTLYRSTTTDQIVTVSLDQITGATGMKINAGAIRNEGIEIAATFVPVRTKDFTWSFDVNWARNYNKLVRLQDGWDPTVPLQTDMGTTIGSRTFIYSYVGQEMNVIYGRGFQRAPQGAFITDDKGNKVDVSGQVLVDPATGYPMLDDNPTRRIGKVNPDWRGGMTQRFRYKNWNLAATFSASYGGHAFSVTNFALSYQGKLTNSLEGRNDGLVHPGVNAIKQADGSVVYKKNTTITQNIETYYNMYMWNRNNTEANTFSTSFLKLKEVRLDYAFSPELLKKTRFLQGASVGAYATNLFCITKFPQYDPEMGMLNGSDIHQGIEAMSFPSTRTYGVNIKLQF